MGVFDRSDPRHEKMMALAEKWGFPEGAPFPWWLVKEAGYSDEEIAEMLRILAEKISTALEG